MRGQDAQLADSVDALAVAAAFKNTVEDLRTLAVHGSFFPPGTRKPLVDLLAERANKPTKIADTSHLQALLWAPRRWRVQDHPELDFYFVERELTPGSAVTSTKRSWQIDKKHRLSADALLVNVGDRTPIVAEIKVGGDQNAEYGLLQALAAAAQLAPERQRKRLRITYRDHFGTETPERLDVYVILADRPTRGTRPQLLTRALALSEGLMTDRLLEPWIRRICLLKTAVMDGLPVFKRIVPVASDRR